MSNTGGNGSVTGSSSQVSGAVAGQTSGGGSGGFGSHSVAGAGVTMSGGAGSSGWRQFAPYITPIAPLAATLEALVGTPQFEELWCSVSDDIADRLAGVLADHIEASGNLKLLDDLVERNNGELSTYQISGLVPRMTPKTLAKAAARCEQLDEYIAAKLKPSEWGEELTKRYLDERTQIRSVMSNEEVRFLLLKRLLTLKGGDIITQEEYDDVKAVLYDTVAYTESWLVLCSTNHPAALSVALREAAEYGWGSSDDETAYLYWIHQTSHEVAREYDLYVPKDGTPDREWIDQMRAEASQRGVVQYCNDRLEGVVKEALGQVVGWEERWGDDLKGARADLEEALFTLGPDFWQGSWRDVLEARWKTVAESEEWQTSQEGGAALEVWGLAPWHRYDKVNHVSDPEAATWLLRGLLTEHQDGVYDGDTMRPAWYIKAVGVSDNLDLLTHLYEREVGGLWAPSIARRIVDIAGPETAAELVGVEHFLRHPEARNWWKEQMRHRPVDRHLIMSLGQGFQGTPAQLLACCDQEIESGAA